MACKSKKTKLKKYSKGSTLPKKDGILGSSYLDDTTNMFAKQQNLDPYESLAGLIGSAAQLAASFVGDQSSNPQYGNYDSIATNNQYQSSQQYGPGLNASANEYAGSAISNGSLNKNNNFSLNNFLDFGEQGNFGDTQYGDTDIGGELAAVGAAASIGASLIDANKTDEQQAYTDSGSSWSQDLVGMVGPWGSAISGVSQLAASALESGVDYDEYGVAENQSYNKFAKSLETGLLDPAQNLDVVFSDEYSTGERIGAALVPGLAGIFQADKEQEEAIARKAAAKRAMEQQRLNQINQGVNNRQNIFKYGGKLRKYQNGGGINTLVPKNISIDYPQVYIGERAINANPGEGRVSQNLNIGLTNTQAKNILREEGLDINSLIPGKLPEGLDSNKYYPYTDRTGNPSIGIKRLDPRTTKTTPNERQYDRLELYPYQKKFGGNIDYMNPSHSNRPTVFQYGGQTHEGPNEGIEVDGTGIPSIMSGKAPVALTEKGEVAFKSPDMESAYIFSDSIKYKKL